MLPKECLCSGASETCPDCGVTVQLRICKSAAGHYIGTYCDCGPYTRESSYFLTYAMARASLVNGGWVDRSGVLREGVANIEE